VNENDPNEKFSMSFLAARLSQEVNGVSQLHGKVSQRIFSPLWKGYAPEELHISYVTNGVHYPTWTAPDWQRFYDKYFGEFKNLTPDKDAWSKIYEVNQKSIWDVHQGLKKDLLRVVNERVTSDESMPFQNRKIILEKLSLLDEKTLIIGYARRFVRYKRSYLLFLNREKLLSIMRNAGCPVLFLFAGKAHPADQEGKDMVKRLIEISKDPDFAGSVIFLNDYDIELAKRLVRGVDVWLNTPELELEASGTSGMKAAMNGVLNFSMLDGWWAEGYREDAGWAIGGRTKLDDSEIQDEMDADSLYRTLEQSVIPTYTDSNEEGVPLKWVSKIENSIAHIAPQFTMKRMLEEYESKFYQKLYQRCSLLSNNNFEAAVQLAAWKSKVAAEWNQIEIVSADIYDSANKAFPLGGNLSPKIVLYMDDISVNDVGVELLFIKRRKPGVVFGKIISHYELLPIAAENKQVTFSAEIPMNQTGVYEYAIRVFPKNALLPYRMDFPLYKWF
jgi:alpha-glucan phosphorylase-like protein